MGTNRPKGPTPSPAAGSKAPTRGSLSRRWSHGRQTTSEPVARRLQLEEFTTSSACAVGAARAARALHDGTLAAVARRGGGGHSAHDWTAVQRYEGARRGGEETLHARQRWK